MRQEHEAATHDEQGDDGRIRFIRRDDPFPPPPYSGLRHARARDAPPAVCPAVCPISDPGIDEMTELHDADSADILTEISRGVDKWLWFVEAHQQG